MNKTTVSATLISTTDPVNADDLAHLCGVQRDWVIRVVEVGILQLMQNADISQWQFVSQDIARALEARRLEHLLNTNLDAVAMLMELSQEIRRLKSLLQTHGLPY